MRQTRMSAPPSRERGLTLVELMVAMTLGLVVVGGAVSLMLANRRSYSTNEGFSQVQESARTAFELISRDLRQAGITGCNNPLDPIMPPPSNVLDTSAGTWWQTWFGLEGYEAAEVSAVAAGTARGQRVAGTDSLQTQGIQGLGISVESHVLTPPPARMVVSPGSGLVAGDVLVACDFRETSIFQVTSFNAGTREIRHDIGVGTPGNCSTGLAPGGCAGTGDHLFQRNALLARLAATEWYIGNSGRAADTGRSLFRLRLDTAGALVTEEVVTDVTDMQITYRFGTQDNFVAATALATGDWPEVNAVRIALTVNSADARVSTDAAVDDGRLERTFTQVIALRNRIQ